MRLSIITITMNSERFLRETIESVISQDYQDIEYLLIDGGSTDGTLDIIKSSAAGDGRIRWVSERDNGISDAMNKGIRMATGEVISHIHSDDYYAANDVLSSVVSAFREHPGANWLTGGAYVVDELGAVLREIRVRRYSYRKLVRCNFILHPATFVTREGFARAGMFDVARRYAMDYDLWLRLGALGAPVSFSRPLACFRLHEGSLSSAETTRAFDEALLIRRELLRERPVIFFFHYIYYLLKKRRNRNYVRRLQHGMNRFGE